MTLNYDLYIEEYDLYVELECECITQNDGIGSYEYWGSQEYDAGEDYLICEHIEWDKEDYTEEQNAAIDKYLEENFCKIADKAIEKFDPSDYI